MILASHSPLENVLQPHGNILHPGSWEATHHLVVSFAARESSVWTPNYLVPFHYRSPKHHPSLLSLRANHSARDPAAATALWKVVHLLLPNSIQTAHVIKGNIHRRTLHYFTLLYPGITFTCPSGHPSACSLHLKYDHLTETLTCEFLSKPDLPECIKFKLQFLDKVSQKLGLGALPTGVVIRKFPWFLISCKRIIPLL